MTSDTREDNDREIAVFAQLSILQCSEFFVELNTSLTSTKKFDGQHYKFVRYYAKRKCRRVDVGDTNTNTD